MPSTAMVGLAGKIRRTAASATARPYQTARLQPCPLASPRPPRSPRRAPGQQRAAATAPVAVRSGAWRRRRAKEIPARARLAGALDGTRLRDTWSGSAARSLRALVPPDRACVVDVALAADRAVIAGLAIGRVVVVATRRKFECGALSQLERGVWLATLDGATAPEAREPRLADRPDFAELRAHLTAPLAAVAPDGDPASGIVFATAAASDPAHAE